MKYVLIVAATLALLISACSPQAAPTADPVQAQASVVAAANTMVALTMAAIPTATSIPPTPIPSPTLEPSPTPIPTQASPTVAATSSGKGDPCLGPLVSNGGPDIKNVRIFNETNQPIILSLHLDKNAFAECGFRGFNIGPNQSIDVSNLKAGCYFAAAIIGSKSKAFGSTCISDYTHGWWIKVMADQITFVGP